MKRTPALQRRSQTFLWIIGVALLSASAAFAQSTRSDKLVKVEGLLSRDKVHAGEKFKAAVMMNVQKGYHINAHKPADEFLIGTDLKLKPTKGFTCKEIVYPKDIQRKLPFSDKPLKVYEGKQAIIIPVVAAKDLSPGKYTIVGDLRVQSCSETSCYAPATIKASIPLQVVPSDVQTKDINKEVFSPGGAKPAGTTPGGKGSVASGTAAGTNELAKRIQERGLLLTFLSIFFGGLALNLTPCVYPLIPITVGYFGGQSEGRASRTFTLALFYVAGIAITYSALGVFSAMAGKLMGSLLQNPLVPLFVAAVLVALALSMFGLYEIQPPQFITRRSGAKKGNLGALAMGLVVGLVAAPCLAPVLVSLLTYVAAKRDPLLGFWMFFTLAIGMGLPYLFLGTFAGAAKSLPRSGVWLLWIKKVFGVVLLGVAIYVLNPLMPMAVERYTLYIFLVLGGLYLGWLESSGKELRKFIVSKRTIGLIVMMVGIWSTFKTAVSSPGVHWQPFSEASFQNAKVSGKPVVIDFYANWCADCKALDRRTYTDPQVTEAMQKLVRLKADLTNDKEPEKSAIWKEFNIKGLPTVIFIDKTGQELRELRLEGFEAPGQFLGRLSRVSEPE